MIIDEPLYGKFQMSPVIDALIASSEMQRLKKIHQGGAIFLVNPSIKESRFEHSIGVTFLVQRFGGNTAEQIAALLHDVSHTAFSHVTDYVFNRKEEDYHEQIFSDFINASSIPDILSRYGYKVEELLTDNYSLLEQPYPNLCADRIDYTLRDSFKVGWISLKEIQSFINQLDVRDGRIVCSEKAAMEWFREIFKKLNTHYFRKPEHLYANHRLAALLQQAIRSNVISEGDLMGNDDEIISILRKNHLTSEALLSIEHLTDFDNFDVDAAASKIKKREL